MKQIFDWLREQIQGLSNAEADYYYANSNDVIDREDTLDLINEAEAKWNNSSNKAIEILKTEKECVLRNINRECNRECAKCDLLREDAEILKAYDDAILALGYREVE